MSENIAALADKFIGANEDLRRPIIHAVNAEGQASEQKPGIYARTVKSIQELLLEHTDLPNNIIQAAHNPQGSAPDQVRNKLNENGDGELAPYVDLLEESELFFGKLASSSTVAGMLRSPGMEAIVATQIGENFARVMEHAQKMITFLHANQEPLANNDLEAKVAEIKQAMHELLEMCMEKGPVATHKNEQGYRVATTDEEGQLVYDQESAIFKIMEELSEGLEIDFNSLDKGALIE